MANRAPDETLGIGILALDEVSTMLSDLRVLLEPSERAGHEVRAARWRVKRLGGFAACLARSQEAVRDLVEKAPGIGARAALLTPPAPARADNDDAPGGGRGGIRLA